MSDVCVLVEGPEAVWWAVQVPDGTEEDDFEDQVRRQTGLKIRDRSTLRPLQPSGSDTNAAVNASAATPTPTTPPAARSQHLNHDKQEQ